MSIQFGSFEFKPSLVPTIIFLLLLPFLLSLGNWQMNRASEKKSLDDDRVLKLQSETLDLNLIDEMSVTDRYRKARVKGVFDNDQFWLLDNQVANNQAGYHVYSLFSVDANQKKYILVNRGWVPVGTDRGILPAIETPGGPQILFGRLDNPASVGIRLGEPAYDLDKVVLYLDIEDFANTLSLPLFKYALVLDKGQKGLFQHDWEQASEMTPAKHVGYAFQWFALATALIIIYVGVNTRKVDSQGDKSA